MKKTITDNISLTKEDFSFVCPLKTEDMNVVDGGYFCGKCEKKVHDVTDYTEEEFGSLKQKSDNLCITIKKVAAVSLVLGLSACSTQTTGKISSNPKCNTPIKENNNTNRLRPFPIVDKNQTITIDRTEEPEIAGGIMAPAELSGNH
jgi:hypothetical protein